MRKVCDPSVAKNSSRTRQKPRGVGHRKVHLQDPSVIEFWLIFGNLGNLYGTPPPHSFVLFCTGEHTTEAILRASAKVILLFSLKNALTKKISFMKQKHREARGLFALGATAS